MLLSSSLIAILFSFSTYAFETKSFPVALLKSKPKNKFELQKNIDLVGRPELTSLLREFVTATPKGRMVGTPGQKVARETLKALIDTLSSGNGVLKIDPFKPKVERAISNIQKNFEENVSKTLKVTNPTYQKARRYKDSFISYANLYKGEEGRNLVWEKMGTTHPNEVVVVLAHYDTLSVNDGDRIDPKVVSPGADDNGSGVAIALQLIQIFSRMEIPRTLRVVFLDWEELGNLGSLAFVERYREEYKKKKLLGFVNLEMLGHDSRTEDQTKKNGNMRSYYRRPGSPLFNEEQAFVQQFLKDGKSIESHVKFTPIGNSYPHSGSLSQWEEGMIGITFSQNWEEDYNKSRNHGPNDFVETLNFTTLHSSYRFIAAGLGRLIFSF